MYITAAMTINAAVLEIIIRYLIASADNRQSVYILCVLSSLVYFAVKVKYTAKSYN